MIQGQPMRLSRATTRLTIAVAAVALALSPVMAVGPPGERPYFPERAFYEDKERNDFWDKEYTKALRAMGEPSLWKLAEDGHAVSVYRLLWVSSFHHRVSVRIVKSGGSFVLHAVELDGKGGLDPGKIAIKKS